MSSIKSAEGWFVLHLYYKLNRQVWASLESQEIRQSQEALQSVLDHFCRSEHCQAHTYSIWGHKADFGILLVDPDLDHMNETENLILAALPPDSVDPVHSFTSMSEISEYLSQEKDYDRTLREKEGLSPESPEYKEKMEAFRQRIRHYTGDRLHPQLPSHSVMCFYPMNKARRDANNWYMLDFEERKRLMAGHMVTGRKFAGKVSQLVTGAFGLDDWEWGVTLFTEDPLYLKQILYEMRFDDVSAVYGEFGEFLVGIRMGADELFGRLQLG